MSVDQELAAQFGDYRAAGRCEAWTELKDHLALGAYVQGPIMARFPFGVFIDIGVGFPTLLLIVKDVAHQQKAMTFPDDYPGLGTLVGGRVYVLVDESRQIGITQLPREPWMMGDW